MDTWAEIARVALPASSRPAAGARDRRPTVPQRPRRAGRYQKQASRFVRYAGAAAVNLLALTLAFFLEPQFSSSPFVLFLAAVMYSSWYGGRIAGLAAVAFGTWASNYFLMGPMSLAGVYQPA